MIIIGLLVLGCVAVAAWLLLAFGVTFRCLRRPPRRSTVQAVTAGNPLVPEDAGWPAEHWYFRGGDGLDLPAWTVRDGGEGPVTILVHDWGRSRVDCLPLLGDWLPESDAVVLPDLRGHGDASGLCTFGHLEIDDLLRLLDSLEAHTVRLVGRGFGATLVLQVTAMRPESVSEVIAIEPWSPDLERLREHVRAAGLTVQPKEPILGWALRLAGSNRLAARPIKAGPVIRLLVSGDASDLQQLLARDDVQIIRGDESSR